MRSSLSIGTRFEPIMYTYVCHRTVRISSHPWWAWQKKFKWAGRHGGDASISCAQTRTRDLLLQQQYHFFRGQGHVLELLLCTSRSTERDSTLRERDRADVNVLAVYLASFWVPVPVAVVTQFEFSGESNSKKSCGLHYKAPLVTDPKRNIRLLSYTFIELCATLLWNAIWSKTARKSLNICISHNWDLGQSVILFA